MFATPGTRARETASVTGTGDYTLSGAVTGYRTLDAAVGNNNYCNYYAFQFPLVDGGQWEEGLGRPLNSGANFRRDVIIRSSNSDAAVNWAGESLHIIAAPSSLFWEIMATSNVARPAAPHVFGSLSNASAAFGSGCEATAFNSFAFGSQAKAWADGGLFAANGRFEANGDGQSLVNLTVRAERTNAIDGYMQLDGASRTWWLPNNIIGNFEALVVASRDGSLFDLGMWRLRWGHMGGGGTIYFSERTELYKNVGWTADVNITSSFNTTDSYIRVNGVDGQTVRFVANVRAALVTR